MIDIDVPEPEATADSSPQFKKSIWNIMYPGTQDIPDEKTVIAHLKEFLKQKDRQTAEAQVSAIEFQSLAEENAGLRDRLEGATKDGKPA